MKRYFTLIFLTASLFFLATSCDNAISVGGGKAAVQIDSLSYVGQDSVLIHCTITSTGNRNIETWGVRMSEYEDMYYLDVTEVEFKAQNDSLALDLTFGGVFEDLPEGETRFFQAFLTTEGEDVESEVLELEIPFTPPPVTPCEVTKGDIIFLGTEYKVGSISAGFNPSNDYEIRFSASAGAWNSIDFRFEFPTTPVNGRFTALEYFSFWRGPGIRFFTVYANTPSGLAYSIEEGYCYVTDNEDGTFRVEFCELPLSVNNQVLTISGSFETD